LTDLAGQGHHHLSPGSGGPGGTLPGRSPARLYTSRRQGTSRSVRGSREMDMLLQSERAQPCMSVPSNDSTTTPPTRRCRTGACDAASTLHQHDLVPARAEELQNTWNVGRRRLLMVNAGKTALTSKSISNKASQRNSRHHSGGRTPKREGFGKRGAQDRVEVAKFMKRPAPRSVG